MADAFTFRILRPALRHARYWELSRDFKDSYREHRRAGYDVEAAAWMALYDWDILDNKPGGGLTLLAWSA